MAWKRSSVRSRSGPPNIPNKIRYLDDPIQDRQTVDWRQLAPFLFFRSVRRCYWAPRSAAIFLVLAVAVLGVRVCRIRPCVAFTSPQAWLSVVMVRRMI